MTAKSASASGALDPRPLRQVARNVVSWFVLLASVTAFVLVLDSLHGPILSSHRLAGELDLLEAAPGAAGPQPKGGAGKAEELRYRALADFLARRYRVSQDVTFDLVGLAHRAGRQVGLDPLLILAVMAVESSLNPIAESVKGAKGLMQIIPRYHPDKIQPHGDERALFDPAVNIHVGAQILKDYLRLTGDLGVALQMYAGALDDATEEYTRKVLGEKQRLAQALAQLGSAERTQPARTAAARPEILGRSSPH